MKRCALLMVALLSAPAAFAADKLPKDCKPGELWVHSYSKTQFGKPIWVSSYCRSFPTTEIKKFWINQFKDQVSYWPNPTEEQRKWSEKERLETIAALNRVPLVLWNKLKGIIRFDRSKDFPNQSSYGGGHIALYDAAFAKGENLTRLCVHELAHALWDESSIEWQESYYDTTGWTVLQRRPGQSPVTIGRILGYVQTDGKFRPDEDFANNIESYIFERERLIEVTPSAHKWIRDRFGDSLKLR